MKDAVTNLYSGNVVGAIKGGMDLAKNGSSLASGKIPASGGNTTGTAETNFEDSLNGTLNMMMNGTINTDGAIHGSAPTVGIVSPTFYLKDFDTKNSHLGQGVWNLKKTPMVYATNSQNIVDFWPDNPDVFTTNWLFFDPSSIEVELNPNIFPEDEIEWMQVDAIAGARKEMPRKGTDPFRQAIGLKPIADYKFESYNGSFVYERKGDDINNYVFNFVGAGDFDGQTIEGTNFPISYAPFESGYTYYLPSAKKDYIVWPRVFGSGTEDYIIEPQTTGWEYLRSYDIGDHKFQHNPSVFPAVEINVSVLVKLKSLDAPILFYTENIGKLKQLVSEMLPSEEYKRKLEQIDEDENEKLKQPVSEFPSAFACVPWGHHVRIVQHSETIEEALFYVGYTIKEGISRDTLESDER